MKCKRCGYRARTIAGLAAHYRKKHPGAMKARMPRSVAPRQRTLKHEMGGAPGGAKAQFAFCPHCGGRL